jgi:hypothetical protein
VVRGVEERGKEMTKKASLWLLAMVTAGAPAAAAEAPRAPNSIYVELLGNAVLYSLNFDHKFTDNVSLRVGFAYSTFNLPSTSNIESKTIAVPIMVNYLVGRGSHRLETGAGFLPLLNQYDDSADSVRLGLTGTVGYRYQRPAGGFVFRIGFTPLLASDSDGGYFFAPWLGMSFGVGF